jgi:hypothetical protein
MAHRAGHHECGDGVCALRFHIDNFVAAAWMTWIEVGLFQGIKFMWSVEQDYRHEKSKQKSPQG